MSCLFVEQLTVLDCAYLDAGRGLVGESWIVDVELEGDLDDQSMVLDFGEVKRRLKRCLDGNVDHTLVVPMAAPELSLQNLDDQVRLLFRSDLGAIEHCSPPQALTLLDAASVDGAALAAHLQPIVAAILPPNVERLTLNLRHERHQDAYYHYVHGLKKHDGLCQRIAHGHRSRLEIHVDGHRDPALEQAFAVRWTDIYLGSREDIVARGNGRLRYRYLAAEGLFELALPESRCHLLDGDTTVERIAQHLLERAALERPGARLEVRAYEGVMKGGIARG